MRASKIAHGSMALIAIAALLFVSPGPLGNDGTGNVAWAQPAPLPDSSDPPDRVGRLNYLNGPVSYAPAGVNQWANATLNYPLTTGSALWTDEGGRAELHVGPTAIRMDELTEVQLLNLDDQSTQVRVAQGTIDVGLRYLEVDEEFEIATPSASVLLVEPGHYRIEVTENDVLVTVWQGEAEVETSGQSFFVSAGETVLVTETGYQAIANPDHAEFDRWALAREAQEARASHAAAPYVPPLMTGYEDLGRHGRWRVIQGHGAAWFPSVRPGWAPYRDGRWVWMARWGWTWVDDAPWGFAPFHYGRWVLITGVWAWIPGPITVRPVFAPALVVFVTIGNVIGWFPIAPHEVYVPPYHASPAYRRRINITVVNININITNVRHVHYVYRGSHSATTSVHKNTFMHSGPINRRYASIPRGHFDRAELTATAPVQPRVHNVLGHPQDGIRSRRPPARVEQRPVVVRRAPPAPHRPQIDGPQAQPRVVPVRPVNERRRDDDRRRENDRRRANDRRPSDNPIPGAPAPRVTPAPQQIQPVVPTPQQPVGVPTPRRRDRDDRDRQDRERQERERQDRERQDQERQERNRRNQPPQVVNPTPQTVVPAPRVTPAPQQIQPQQPVGVPTPRRRDRDDGDRQDRERQERERQDRDRQDREREDRERQERNRREQPPQVVNPTPQQIQPVAPMPQQPNVVSTPRRQDREERERQERERQVRDRQDRERQDRERQDRERQDRERQERERQERERQERERQERERQDRERQDRERQERNRRDQPQLAPTPRPVQPIGPPQAPRDDRSVDRRGRQNDNQRNQGRPVCDERSPYHDPRLCPQQKRGRR